ncbi:nitrate reductase, partial [Sinorhizobium meliloti]|nr:nitrate reductase [Sinorhizobium meliloti]
MRGQNRLCRMMRSPGSILGAPLAILVVATGAIAQMADKRVPELSGPPQEMGEVEA